MLRNEVNPRVQTTVFRLLFNGWHTCRRHQARNGVCFLGCNGAHREDAIEHYGGCPTFRKAALSYLRISETVLNDRGKVFMLYPLNEETRTRLAILWHAVYRLRNDVAHRHLPSPLSPSDSLSYLWAEIKDAVAGHNRSARKVPRLAFN